MEHFVGYHNRDKEGPYRLPLRGESRRWNTAKRFLEGTIVRNRLWGIEGGGSPKRYRLVSSGIVTHVTPGKYVQFRVDADFEPIDLTDLSWFRILLEQRAFSHSLSRITDRRVIAALEVLRTKGVAAKGKRAARIANLTRTDPPSRVLRAIKERQGRFEFRNAVLAAYERRCAISNCDVEHALDAAHIEPFSGGRSDRLKNAILLRTDLHTLFDYHLIGIDAKTWRIAVSDELRRSTYGKYHGAKVRRPRAKAHWPDRKKLNRHRRRLA